MRLGLSYGHLAFIAAVMLLAVGMREAVGQPTDRLGWSVTGLLYGGAVLYLATLESPAGPCFALSRSLASPISVRC